VADGERTEEARGPSARAGAGPAPLHGRHALVTGASRGIGAAIAARLDALGARVTLVARDRAALEARAAALRRGHALVADLLDPEAVETAFAAAAQRAPIDILVNNAGAAQSAPLARTDEALWRFMIEVNLSSVYRCTRAVLPAMVARGWGRVANVASVAGLRGYAYVSAYCAAKHGVIGLTRALAMEAAQAGVTVNAVCPGYTETALLAAAIDNIAATTARTPEQARRDLLHASPQRRFVQPEEVAATVAWLCLPESAAITGQAIAVAGGEVT